MVLSHFIFEKIEEHTKTVYSSSPNIISSILHEAFVFDDDQRLIETYFTMTPMEIFSLTIMMDL